MQNPRLFFKEILIHSKLNKANWYKTIALINRASIANLERFPPWMFIFSRGSFLFPPHIVVSGVSTAPSWPLGTCTFWKWPARSFTTQRGGIGFKDLFKVYANLFKTIQYHIICKWRLNRIQISHQNLFKLYQNYAMPHFGLHLSLGHRFIKKSSRDLQA